MTTSEGLNVFDPETEHGPDGISGMIRDFTRRYGMLDAESRDETGVHWEPIVQDRILPITSRLMHGMRTVDEMPAEPIDQSPSSV